MANTKIATFRISAPEKQALAEFAADCNLSVNAVIVKVLREVLDAGPYLIADDLSELSEATQQLAAIGRNLNQIVRAINSNHDRKIAIDADYLASINAHVDGVAAAVGRLMERQKERWAPIRKAASGDV